MTGDRKLALRLTLSEKDYASVSSLVVRQHFILNEGVWRFPDSSTIIGYNPAFTLFCNEKRNEFFKKVFEKSLEECHFEETTDPIDQFLGLRLADWNDFVVPAPPKSARQPSTTIGWEDLV